MTDTFASDLNDEISGVFIGLPRYGYRTTYNTFWQISIMGKLDTSRISTEKLIFIFKMAGKIF